MKITEEVKTGDFVVPGDFLATAEEFVPDEGVYEDNNGIYSTRTGIILKDIDSKKISVHPKTKTPPSLEKGDIVVGRVGNISRQVANVEIGAVRGKEDREIPFNGDVIIHISKISDDYVEEIEDKLKPNDIVRARIVEVSEDDIGLSTMDENLGVLVAYCSECRYPMEKRKSDLKCPNCGTVSTRKLANDYRQGIF